MTGRIETMLKAVADELHLSEEELLKEAIRALFEVNPQLKIEVALELYKDGEVSLEKAG